MGVNNDGCFRKLWPYLNWFEVTRLLSAKKLRLRNSHEGAREEHAPALSSTGFRVRTGMPPIGFPLLAPPTLLSQWATRFANLVLQEPYKT